MADLVTTATSTDLQQNLLSETDSAASDSHEVIGTVNQTSDLPDVDEPPAKKCKIASNDKPRLLEDRIGSILSCCICLDLSTLPIFQVKLRSFFSFEHKHNREYLFVLVCEWTFDVCFMF